MNRSDIVITGVGVVSSIGLGREAFTQSLLQANSGVIELVDSTVGDRNATARFKFEEGHSGPTQPESAVEIGAPITEFDPKQYVKPRKALKVMCREIQTSFAASQMAIEDAGLTSLLPAEPAELAKKSGRIAVERIGTVFGSEMLYGDPEELADAFAACKTEADEIDRSKFGNAAMRSITPLWMLKYLPNMPACHVGIAVNSHGPNNTLTVGDVSGPNAVLESCGYLRRGIADIMVAAAAGSRMNTTRTMFTEDQPLTGASDPVCRSSRPHAKDAQGIVRGEGAACLILESGESASSGNRKPIARVLGMASRFVPSAAFAAGQFTSSSEKNAGRGSSAAIEIAIQAALSDAGLTANDIGLVVGHGMGDPVIDAQEAEAITKALPGVPVTLPIGLLGHTGAATGMLGLIAAVVAAQRGVAPPVAHASDCPEPLNVVASSTPLTQPNVIALSHTSHGSATAIIVSAT
ncbi:3-oxoacyl-[acyl-carrier-protein] synthase, KASII [Rhodopirellula islandica]|uniref:3-oxoacyl-[acyl-carrier-protein] synthase, KASII n=1 Tax=Rhodopirellula islandica TaxID=595434 RepID=A0A0J1BD20_RHOIS|nr:beta-ketoacyl synthase [Rhodopirellula islandica]KLU04488.1 3-oxoacyl-[acyl-carrier-protein] synthase, KASII [Rhodopirellula islandica]